MTASTVPLGRGPVAKSHVDAISDWCVYAAIGAYTLFAVLGFWGSEVNSFDESLQFLGGREVLEGRAPHRDFWSMYPPLNYYLDSLVFRAFGSSFMVARFLSALIYGVAVLALSRYVNNRLKMQAAPLRWLTMGLAVFCLTRVLQLAQNNTILAAVLVLIYFLSELDREGQLSRRALLVCGFASGVLLTMRLNLGLYVVAAIGTTLVVTGESSPTQAFTRRHLQRVLTFVVPVCAAFSFFLLPYGRFAKDVISQMAVTPNLILRAGHATDVSKESAPYCCLLAVVGFALVCCRLDWRNSRDRTIALLVAGTAMVLATLSLLIVSAARLLLVPYAIPGILIGILIASQVAWSRFHPRVFVGLCFLIASLQYYLVRGDGLHLFVLGGAVAIVAAAGIVSQPQLPRVAVIGLLFWLMMRFPLPVDRVGIAQWLWPLNPKAILPVARVISSRHSFLALGDSARVTNGQPLLAFERRFFPDPDELSVIRYVDRFASPSDAVFMGLTSHDRTRVNDARLSWLMPRPLASRYLELEPGIITSESVQREVVQSLSSGIRWLVLQDTAITGTAGYPFQRSAVLDQYIAANYKRAMSFGKFHVYCRLEACPSP
jgi:hypothetical protein